MMSVRLRLAAMVARWALWGRKQPRVGTSRLPMRCWLVDCDLNLHMNNSRYLSMMDMARWHLSLVNGLAESLHRRRWMPVAVRVEIDYKRSIQPGERFEIETYPVGVGTKSLTLAQRFWVQDELAADARVVVVFRGQGKTQAIEAFHDDVPLLFPREEAQLQGATATSSTA